MESNSAYTYTGASLGNLVNPNAGDTMNNWLHGGVDFQRDLYKLGLENTFNAEQAQFQRDFEERMSSTAYTRAAADLRNAGLNPALLYSSASPASTPSGSSAYSGSGGAAGSRQVDVLGLLTKVAGIAISAYTGAQFNAGRLALQKEQLDINKQWLDLALDARRRSQAREAVWNAYLTR